MPESPQLWSPSESPRAVRAALGPDFLLWLPKLFKGTTSVLRAGNQDRSDHLVLSVGVPKECRPRAPSEEGFFFVVLFFVSLLFVCLSGLEEGTQGPGVHNHFSLSLSFIPQLAPPSSHSFTVAQQRCGLSSWPSQLLLRG